MRSRTLTRRGALWAFALAFLALAVLGPGSSARAWEVKRPLLVGMGPFAPFVMLDQQHKASGFSIDLWREVTRELV